MDFETASWCSEYRQSHKVDGYQSSIPRRARRQSGRRENSTTIGQRFNGEYFWDPNPFKVIQVVQVFVGEEAEITLKRRKPIESEFSISFPLTAIFVLVRRLNRIVVYILIFKRQFASSSTPAFFFSDSHYYLSLKYDYVKQLTYSKCYKLAFKIFHLSSIYLTYLKFCFDRIFIVIATEILQINFLKVKINL